MQQKIATYLDTPSLCIFGRVSKRCLSVTSPELRARMANFFKSPSINFQLNLNISFMYNSKAIYVCGSNMDSSGRLGLDDIQENYDTFTCLPQFLQNDILHFVTSESHTLALTRQGLFACGANNYGQLGFGHASDVKVLKLTPVNNGPPGSIQKIAVGEKNTLVLTDQGLFGCGMNGKGMLGVGHNKACLQFTPITSPPPGKIKQIIMSNNHSLIITDQGLYGCGSNEDGQLGLGAIKRCNIFTCILKNELFGQIKQVVSGDMHTIVLTEQGLYGCGYNEYGQLGLGHKHDCRKLTPITQLPVGTIYQVMVGWEYKLLWTDKGLYGCGSNQYSQMGLERTKKYLTFTPITNLPPGKIQQVLTGPTHSMILTDEGLYGCGDNDKGQVGISKKIEVIKTYTKVNDVPDELQRLQKLYQIANRLIDANENINSTQQVKRFRQK